MPSRCSGSSWTEPRTIALPGEPTKILGPVPMTMYRHAARLIAKGIGLVAGTFALIAGVVFLVPEGNDYGLATVLKHDRLARDVPRKIVFIGGSNLAFGMDSGMVEKATGLPVVNMGMNG